MEMTKVSQMQHNTPSYQSERKTSNLFPEMSNENFYHHHSKKSPKTSKKIGKCLQIMLICQKLIQPFTSSSKVVKVDDVKKYYNINKKEKPIVDDYHSNRSSVATAVQISKMDACVQTNDGSLEDVTEMIYEDGYGTNLDSKEFPSDIDSSVKDPYWELDIDSAIVGDYTHTSAFSLTEQIDPLYAAIKITSDGRFTEKSQNEMNRSFNGYIYPEEKRSCSSSSASSLKSGIYMKIKKGRKSEDLITSSNDMLRAISSSRLNFEHIMQLRARLGLLNNTGLGINPPSLSRDVYCPDTPDIPRRSYGSSVINFITELRQNNVYNHSSQNFSVSSIERSNEDLDYKILKSHIYSPIWSTKIPSYNLSTQISETPLSEPLVQKKSINKMLYPFPVAYPDDISDNLSTVSINDPSKLKYCYPPNYSDSKQCSRLKEEINHFRHMDSELDLDNSFSNKDKKAALIHQRGLNTFTDVNLPLKVRTGNVHTLYDDKMLLQPLMERSCEDDYFRRDFLSSLYYINV